MWLNDVDQRITAKEMAEAVSGYGKMTMPPFSSFEDIEVYSRNDPNEVRIDFDLWFTGVKMAPRTTQSNHSYLKYPDLTKELFFLYHLQKERSKSFPVTQIHAGKYHVHKPQKNKRPISSEL